MLESVPNWIEALLLLAGSLATFGAWWIAGRPNLQAWVEPVNGHTLRVANRGRRPAFRVGVSATMKARGKDFDVIPRQTKPKLPVMEIPGGESVPLTLLILVEEADYPQLDVRLNWDDGPGQPRERRIRTPFM